MRPERQFEPYRSLPPVTRRHRLKLGTLLTRRLSADEAAFEVARRRHQALAAYYEQLRSRR